MKSTIQPISGLVAGIQDIPARFTFKLNKHRIEIIKTPSSTASVLPVLSELVLRNDPDRSLGNTSFSARIADPQFDDIL